MDDIALRQFTALDKAPDVVSYIRALEAFDGIAQLQELKSFRSGVRSLRVDAASST